MFKRRHDLSALFRLRAAIWPETGWGRRYKYYRHRIIREAGNARGVAAGLACGVCVSFTPFLGFHIVLAMAGCRLIKANMMAGAIGTLVGNPATFPFMFYLSYQVGNVLLSPFQEAAPQVMVEQTEMLTQLRDAFLPTALGGTVLAFGLFPFAFAACYPIGRAAKALNSKRKHYLRKKARQKQEMKP